jgi:hypothetical protein
LSTIRVICAVWVRPPPIAVTVRILVLDGAVGDAVTVSVADPEPPLTALVLSEADVPGGRLAGPLSCTGPVNPGAAVTLMV